jgi:hypothetical protein
MLMEKPRSFSEMLEYSGVSSSHLTYHLENLGQLVSKTDDGKYRLSKFGEAALATMSKIEETPKESRHFSSLPLKWKSLFVVLLIGLVTLAAVSYTQYQSLNPTFLNGKVSKGGITETLSGFIVYSNGTLVAYGPINITCHVEKLKNGVLLIVPDYNEQPLIANSSRVVTDP